MNSIERYYLTQAGNGIHGFAGVRYQKGNGFFGRILSTAVIPFIKFLGKNVLKAGSNIASDLVDSDDFSLNNLKDVGKKRMREQAEDAYEKVKNKILNGQGIKRKYKRKRKIRKNKSIKDKRKIRKTRKYRKRSSKKYNKKAKFADDFLI